MNENTHITAIMIIISETNINQQQRRKYCKKTWIKISISTPITFISEMDLHIVKMIL